MLGKLLKQDFRATARIILPVYAAVPVLGLFTGLIVRLCESQSNIWISILGSLVSFVFSLALIAAVVTTVVLMILRFYRNLMTDEGYLMFTLPVSTTELICSKLIVSVVWFLGALAVDALGLLLSGMLGGYEDVVRFRFAFTFGAPYSMPTITQGTGRLARSGRGRAGDFVRPCPVPDDLRRHGDRSELQEKQRAHVRRVLLRALDRHAHRANADLRRVLRACQLGRQHDDRAAGALDRARLCLCGRAGILCGLLLPHARHAAQAPEPAITQQKNTRYWLFQYRVFAYGINRSGSLRAEDTSPASPRPGTM